MSNFFAIARLICPFRRPLAIRVWQASTRLSCSSWFGLFGALATLGIVKQGQCVAWGKWQSQPEDPGGVPRGATSSVALVALKNVLPGGKDVFDAITGGGVAWVYFAAMIRANSRSTRLQNADRSVGVNATSSGRSIGHNPILPIAGIGVASARGLVVMMQCGPDA